MATQLALAGSVVAVMKDGRIFEVRRATGTNPTLVVVDETATTWPPPPTLAPPERTVLVHVPRGKGAQWKQELRGRGGRPARRK